MKRFHVHVTAIAQSVRLYARPFGAEPTPTESDCAKWMLDDLGSISRSLRGAAGPEPQGVAWEPFHMLAGIPTFGDSEPADGPAACCVPPPAAAPVNSCSVAAKPIGPSLAPSSCC